MVYYGALSKGCQRCRQRKVKCDQRKPGCLKCEKGQKPCPGCRNLTDLVFRDERQRIKKKCAGEAERSSKLRNLPINYALCLNIEDRAATFFFTHYTTTGPPFCDSYQSWLAKTYQEESPNNLVRHSIQAVGMAAISNISNAPKIVLRAKERYGQALKATNVALYDPAQATADTTLMAILLLGLFVTIMFESWNDSHAWTAHIEGATALLHLRGKSQFTRELGIQLYIQFRQQILQACMQRGVPVPAALVEITMQFEASRQGTQYNSLRPGSLAVLGFRLVNLSAAMNRQQITDANAICRIAVDIDSDLNAWASRSSQSDRKFHEVEADASGKEESFNGRRHVYNSVWGAQVWNNWRSLSIVTNRIILNYLDKQSFESDALKDIMRFHSISVIQSLSADICISTPSLFGSPRQYQSQLPLIWTQELITTLGAPSMIWPLHIVSQEVLNVPNVRSWAVEQLVGINKSMGIKQAAVLANTMG
ncbi:uncharacterized protein BDZ83DRAFT_597303 [Colletotrichum acutatum]|uniref:Zn(2)-C6 fungal-type domain-containing protein n=1 Tax=Glomerella acutata TaxID=27357 RepID=A0AAD8XR69_GLOAC|nr:uncharacterized protein BDZ83DRAFT_597303 [Colletotrichum acutatum]KAK1731956.1 hypothetical protein BDZ83DRAFT_597303 [Colletotrichum acutatum]